MASDNIRYVIFDVSEINKINFDDVLETSADTVRLSVDGTKAVVKWEGIVPLCIQTLETKTDYMSHSEILEIMNSDSWSQPIEAM